MTPLAVEKQNESFAIAGNRAFNAAHADFSTPRGLDFDRDMPSGPSSKPTPARKPLRFDRKNIPTALGCAFGGIEWGEPRRHLVHPNDGSQRATAGEHEGCDTLSRCAVPR